MALRAIIFDMDGILADTEGYQFEAFKQLFAPKGVKLTKSNFSWVGKTSRQNIIEILRKYGIDGDPHTLAQERTALYHKLVKGNIIAQPGIKDLVKRSAKKYKTAVGTSSSQKSADLVLKALRLEQYFDAIVCGDHVQRSKPSPDIFLLAAKKLKVNPENCVVIEDSQSGVKAAKAAGMTCIAVPNVYTKKQRFTSADQVFYSMEELSLRLLETTYEDLHTHN